VCARAHMCMCVCEGGGGEGAQSFVAAWNWASFLHKMVGRQVDRSVNIMAILSELIQNKSHNSVFNNTNTSQINTSPPDLVLPTLIFFQA
jgi:hypothetical protein